MRSDGWIAGVAALAVLSGLAGVLTMMATRPLPEQEAPATSPLLAPTPRPMLCVTPDLVCSAPALPDGYPCSCMYPLRGSVAGRVASIDDADRALATDPGRRDLRLDPDDLFGP